MSNRGRMIPPTTGRRRLRRLFFILSCCVYVATSFSFSSTPLRTVVWITENRQRQNHRPFPPSSWSKQHRHDKPSRYGNPLFGLDSKDNDDDGRKEGDVSLENPSQNNNSNNTSMTNIVGMIKASLLIAGTTVGGGFLALPTSVVVPVGGFVPSAVSLAAVWVYLGVTSLILTDCIVQCHSDRVTNMSRQPPDMLKQHNATLSTTTTTKDLSTAYNSNNNNAGDDDDDMIGIPRVAHYALGARGSAAATLFLVVLTMATLVSQLSRAAMLWVDTTAAAAATTTTITVTATTASWPSSLAAVAPFWKKIVAMMTDDMTKYRLGCVLAATLGAIVSFGGGGNGKETSNSSKSKREETISSAGVSTSLATSVHAVLTVVFLLFIVLLFQAGQAEAVWSRCVPQNFSQNWSNLLYNSLGPITTAIPIMLQLLVYGEILPNVCHMLQYDTQRIRISVLVGSFIPLMLLTGWAALGVALVPAATATAAATVDPVKILLQGGGAVPQRLLILSISAIGTTILGSFLALESAYKDVTGMMTKTMRNGPAETMARKTFWQNRLVSTMCITVPPTLIAAISPSLFLQAIDFAGSYPILLLYGVLPPVMALRLKLKAKRVYAVLASLSALMVTASFWADVRGVLSWVFRLSPR
eukprot:scaffold7227_cov160-Amphora_coffeaeformis.AAC.8